MRSVLQRAMIINNLGHEDLGKLIEERIFPKMIADYEKFMEPLNGTIGLTGFDMATRKRMTDEFVSGLAYKRGSKYIKITGDQNGKFVWSPVGRVLMFIVEKDGTKGLKRGDILKPAGRNAPATNFARGNLLENDLHGVRWTGAS